MRRDRLGCFLTAVLLGAALLLFAHWASTRLVRRPLGAPAPPLQQVGRA